MVQCYNERKTDDVELPGNLTRGALQTVEPELPTVAGNGNLDECLVCSDAKRDTVFKVNIYINYKIFLDGK